MNDKYSSYKNIAESKKSLYQYLLEKTKEYQKEKIEVRDGLSLQLIEKIIHMIQIESEENLENMEWVRKEVGQTDKLYKFDW